MNRVIKFRAWDTVKSEMWDWSDSRMGISSLIADPVSTHALMQFTGLLDKNGKEIYEGDVIFAGRFDTKTGEKYVATIAYDDSNRLRSAHKWYIGGYTLTAYKNSISDFDNEEKWEVIGNIFENPNLLGT